MVIRLEDPPANYDQAYFMRLTRDIETFMRATSLTGRGEFVTVNISQLPTSASGLVAGDLWNDGGSVKVVT